ncbi:cation-transporting P-type ATPase [Thiovibrio frasassiensis]|uniref:Cation-transporting P-type ATPase n=1 Tax=Thiovibrio frasassiensis TaxID=2984131 RepID=A0A9X4MFY9_9BACT|nr:cation-transporting P-type ATPase [Thiovibrio frasassiensis]MDG4475150.1 cation-transporting P-type ATPase [Thiovibrio frasassiensis]
MKVEDLIAKHWHHLPIEEVVELLESEREQGLDRFAVEHRQEAFGPNAITAQKGQSPLIRFLLQFHQPLIYILIASGLITAILGEWVDSGVIFGVVLVNAFVGYIQEAKAVNALAALARTMTTVATVMRQGEKRQIPATELVVGDIVFLQSGDKVPADLRLFQVRDLQIAEAALTGESAPVAKDHGLHGRETVLADRHNMAYASTLVTYGQGKGIVTAIGDATEVGRISKLISAAEALATPLTRKISEFSNVLLYVILGLAGLTIVVGLLRGQPFLEMFMAAVALAVGAIPEGLPAAVTITLAIGVSRMAKKRAIIRKLPAVETLGSTTVICTDKTGTLTENQMTVQEIVAGGVSHTVSGTGYNPLVGTIDNLENAADPGISSALRECLRAGFLCNDSQLVEEEGVWQIQGDPTEGALLTAARKGGLGPETLTVNPRLDTVPFESEHQYMATLHDGGLGAPRLVYLKGAVEAVLARCITQLDRMGNPVPLRIEDVQAAVESMAAKGMRVLAMARAEMAPETCVIHHADLPTTMVFLGLQGMIDPPRPEAVAAVKICQTAGIRVKMITGDHPVTAAAIARQVGLYNLGSTRGDGVPVLTGAELEKLSDSEFIDRAEDTVVFARATPEQKLRLVEALQARGQVVAMTGDGVNDAPALKRADIGVAMGITGTEVAKEAADMVLTDDNFSSIEAAVEEGRGVFDNLTKFIVWTLPTNLGEGLVILTAVFLGVTLPILPVQILWINMTTAGFLGLALAFEPKEPGLMLRPPRQPDAPILSNIVIFRITLVSFLMLGAAFWLFAWEQRIGATLAEARTAAVNAFVMVELFYLFNCRSLEKSIFKLGFFSNLWVLGGSVAMFLLQIAYTYLPVMNRLFQSAPIDLAVWGRTVVAGVVVFVVIEIEKKLWLKKGRVGA